MPKKSKLAGYMEMPSTLPRLPETLEPSRSVDICYFAVKLPRSK